MSDRMRVEDSKQIEPDSVPSGPDMRAKEALKKVTYDLRERAKELNCLYAISEFFERPNISLDEILQSTVNLVPSAWQYPELACARIVLGGRKYECPHFRETPWKLCTEITVSPEERGLLEICYKDKSGKPGEDPFLKEEVRLAKVIAEKLGKIVWTKRAESSLRESEERYRALAEHVTDGVALQQDGRVLYFNAAFANLFGLSTKGEHSVMSLGELVSSGSVHCDDTVLAPDVTEPSQINHFRTRCVAPDGSESWLEGEHIFVQLKGKSAVLSTFRDCTERVRRETEMKEEAESLRQENIHLRSSMKERYRFRDIIGKSRVMQEVYELILKAANSDASVAIFGESGTGKELVAKAIHDLSGRHEKEFVIVNCGAIPENLLESEFFGHRKGAFTGAFANKLGYLDIADHGTLFLDEVGELTLSMQVKLLRAIDGGDYCPVGMSRPKKSNFRIIAATNRNLSRLVTEGSMREDFFYRIHVISITIPPLRERREDIPTLVDHFMNMYRGDGKVTRLPARILDDMFGYAWPGNVRELQNVIRRYLSVGRWDFLSKGRAPREAGNPEGGLKGEIEAVEKNVVRSALEQSNWNRTKAARLLGISRRALSRKIEKLEPV
ncbi:MAG: sigma-54-dependent Fis family transcriptional regulator [Deltaproteobacteria bacterium HGW-Deltaproteobacteria-21]|nr:MAG: sigma-54-dependent Fis family transcriptional regulator [Deltaproteobacteria bacterium HGW-Deltaproteobacteria-21]